MFSRLQDSALKLYVKAQTHLSDDRGQDLIEYALLAALIAVACVTGMKSLATAISGLFSTISTSLSAA